MSTRVEIGKTRNCVFQISMNIGITVYHTEKNIMEYLKHKEESLIKIKTGAAAERFVSSFTKKFSI